MFSGIIKEQGIIKSISNGVLSVYCEKAAKDAYIGQSIAVNGICLTVRKIVWKTLFFDYTPETFRASALKYLKIGESVNIEPALSVNSDISGHFVLGHIDGTGQIINKKKTGNSVVIGIKINSSIEGDIKKYIVKKGSISIDGISLTVNDAKDGEFSVSIIPHTYEETNLKYKPAGSFVNLESDIIEKIVVERLEDISEKDGVNIKTRLTMQFLAENGFA